MILNVLPPTWHSQLNCEFRILNSTLYILNSLLLIMVLWSLVLRTKIEDRKGNSQITTHKSKFRGIILGTAVGDSIGLPAEGISPSRARKLFPGRWRHRLLINKGMVSDDTDHTVFVAQSLLTHPDSVDLFMKRLSRCLRWWLLSLPPGIGFATLRSILRSWLIGPSRSGVYSAGNGPAMRSAPIGAFFALSSERLNDYVQASTRLTHTDPRAFTGAKAVALITGWSIRDNLEERPELEDFLDVLEQAGSQDPEWKTVIDSISAAYHRQLSVKQFAESLGLSKGITGYVYHTVPVVVYAWYLHFGSFEDTLSSVLNCGGDSDTTGAISGALAGSVTGEGGIPADWVKGLYDWPRGVTILRAIADQLAEKSEGFQSGSPVRYFWPGMLVRNLFLLVVVILHILRRLAPP